MLKDSQNQKGSPLSAALHNLASNQNEEQFLLLLRNLLSEQRQMVDILSQNNFLMIKSELLRNIFSPTLFIERSKLNRLSNMY